MVTNISEEHAASIFRTDGGSSTVLQNAGDYNHAQDDHNKNRVAIDGLQMNGCGKSRPQSESIPRPSSPQRRTAEKIDSVPQGGSLARKIAHP
jgi:hypothetical protein